MIQKKKNIFIECAKVSFHIAPAETESIEQWKRWLVTAHALPRVSVSSLFSSHSESNLSEEEYQLENQQQNRLELVPVHEWAIEDVSEWLRYVRDNRLMTMDFHYATQFSKNNIDGLEILKMSDEKLESIGIADPTHRRILLREIAKLKVSNCTCNCIVFVNHTVVCVNVLICVNMYVC